MNIAGLHVVVFGLVKIKNEQGEVTTAGEKAPWCQWQSV